MIRKLAEKVSSAFAVDARERDPAEKEHAIRMATAILMTEVARADFEYDEAEFSLLLDLITKHFVITADEAVELANAASEAADDVISLQKFTQQLNASLEPRDKEMIVLLLWQIAFADGRLDKYEDHLVSRIADLLYVSRGRVMRLKHDANPQAQG